MPIRSFFDQLQNQTEIIFPPKRIVSLVPSQTELLHDLGLADRVVGITKFCVHPGHWSNEKQIIGGTKRFNFDVIDGLQPDLILGNKEENYKEGIDKLREKYPVWMSDIFNLEDAIAMISSVGEITDTETKAKQLIQDVKASFGQVIKKPQQPVLYLIWRKPWMAAGRQTFIDSMLEEIGLVNCVDASRYPELTNDEIKKLNPEIVFLSSEPYPFKENHIRQIQSLLPSSKIELVDGEMFSWYGSRLRLAPAYFNRLRF
jgi:ABC-type Fe3+-hydroxamate transport system substrate-binding protein